MKVRWFEQDGGCRVTFTSMDTGVDESVMENGELSYDFPCGVWETIEKYFNAKVLHRKHPENAFMEGETRWTEARGFE